MVPIELTDEQADKFWAKVDKSGECWEWTGLTQAGYGTVTHTKDKKFFKLRAHRVAYTLTNGPIPEGLVIDHLCHNKKCVRPGHMRATTPKKNNDNRRGPNKNGVSGIRGVSWDSRRGNWRVQVGHNRRIYQGGSFQRKDLAEATAIELRARLHGEAV